MRSSSGIGMFLSKEVATICGALGMVFLAISWHKRHNEGVSRMAQSGWVLVGIYFFNDSLYYFELEDLVLTIMTALALPIAVALVIAESRSLTSRDRAALNWARGCVAYAGGPYLLWHIFLGYLFSPFGSSPLKLRFSYRLLELLTSNSVKPMSTLMRVDSCGMTGMATSGSWPTDLQNTHSKRNWFWPTVDSLELISY